jgi:hypothetical protein
LPQLQAIHTLRLDKQVYYTLNDRSTRLEPARYTEPLAGSRENFVFELPAVEADESTAQGYCRYPPFRAVGIGQIKRQLAAVGFLPIGVEVADNGELSARVAPEPVQMAFVKRSGWVKGVVEFMIPQTEVAGLVHVLHELANAL